MNKNAIAALRGTLRSRTSRKPGVEDAEGTGSVTIDNALPIPLYLYYVNGIGQQNQVLDASGDAQLIAAGASTALELPAGQYVLKAAFSGSFVASFEYANTDSAATISPAADLPTPNDIGLYPTPTTDTPIPLDSPLTLVGCGTLPNGNILCREQYWGRAPDSYVLTPGTKRTVTTTITSGLQQTSSKQEAVSKALGFSAAAGWGPISASISGSLSSNSSTFQQLMVSSETTQYESLELVNKTEIGQMYLKWQLINVVTVLAPVASEGLAGSTPELIPIPPNGPGNLGPIATIVTAESPILIDGPYDPKNLPQPPNS